MDDWGLPADQPTASSPDQTVAPDRAGLERLAPWLQALAIAAAIAILALAPPIAAIAAWVLAALIVPTLWAWFIYQDKQRQLDLGRLRTYSTGLRVNQAMLWLGLCVGVVAGWVFATEVAK